MWVLLDTTKANKGQYFAGTTMGLAYSEKDLDKARTFADEEEAVYFATKYGGYKPVEVVG